MKHMISSKIQASKDSFSAQVTSYFAKIWEYLSNLAEEELPDRIHFLEERSKYTLSDSDQSLSYHNFPMLPARSVIGNPDGYKKTPRALGRNEITDMIFSDTGYTNFSGFMEDDLGDKVFRVRVLGVLLVRDDITGSITHPNGFRWNVRGPMQFENRDQLISFVSTVRSYVDCDFNDGDTASWGNYAVHFVTGSTVIPNMDGFVPTGTWSPRHFGAELDGVANDSNAISNMLTALSGTLDLSTPANAMASIRSFPLRVVDFEGGTALINPDVFTLQHHSGIVFINGTIRANPGATWSTVVRSVSDVSVTFYEPMLTLTGVFSESLDRDYDCQQISFMNMEFDGNDVASNVFCENAYDVEFVGCWGYGWRDTNGAVRGHGLLTAEGKTGNKMGSLRLDRCQFSQVHISDRKSVV